MQVTVVKRPVLNFGAFCYELLRFCHGSLQRLLNVKLLNVFNIFTVSSVRYSIYYN